MQRNVRKSLQGQSVLGTRLIYQCQLKTRNPFDIIGFSGSIIGVRGDVLKRVPLPCLIRPWMRQASSEAGANSRRSRTALRSALALTTARAPVSRQIDGFGTCECSVVVLCHDHARERWALKAQLARTSLSRRYERSALSSQGP